MKDDLLEAALSALRVIHTWAAYDFKRGVHRALDPEDVKRLTERVLEKAKEGTR